MTHDGDDEPMLPLRVRSGSVSDTLEAESDCHTNSAPRSTSANRASRTAPVAGVARLPRRLGARVTASGSTLPRFVATGGLVPRTRRPDRFGQTTRRRDEVCPPAACSPAEVPRRSSACPARRHLCPTPAATHPAPRLDPGVPASQLTPRQIRPLHVVPSFARASSPYPRSGLSRQNYLFSLQIGRGGRI